MGDPSLDTGRAVILFGHGSRDPLWRRPMEAVAARLLAIRPGWGVVCAYLELQQPDLAAATAQLAAEGATAVTIVPMFLGAGKHVREDLPTLVETLRAGYPGVRFTLQAPVGEDPRVLDLLAALATE
jgi:sirohydrochlorin cobaltochelatase